jgi:hypothetical protein
VKPQDFPPVKIGQRITVKGSSIDSGDFEVTVTFDGFTRGRGPKGIILLQDDGDRVPMPLSCIHEIQVPETV